jgi:hypothetical protein
MHELDLICSLICMSKNHEVSSIKSGLYIKCLLTLGEATGACAWLMAIPDLGVHTASSPVRGQGLSS